MRTLATIAVLFLALLAAPRAARAQSYQPPDDVAKARAYVRVELRKLVSASLAPKDRAQATHEMGISDEALTELTIDMLMSVCEKSLAISPAQAKDFLAGKFQDEVNRKAVEAAKAELEKMSMALSAIVMTALNRAETSTGWELEVERRLVEDFLARRKEAMVPGK